MDVIVLTGTPGAGKTTVLNRAMEMLDMKYNVINYGNEMFKVAEDGKIVNDRDEMRKLPPEAQKRIQKLAAGSIAKKAENASIIVDTHCTIKTKKGYLPGLPKWVLDELNPTAILLVEANPEEIINRRSGDETRIRDKEHVSDIEDHQQLNRAVAMSYAMTTGATVKIIKNHDEKLGNAVRQMKDVLV